MHDWNVHNPKPYICHTCGDTDITRRRPRYRYCQKCWYAKYQGAEREARGLKRNRNGEGRNIFKRRITSLKYIYKRYRQIELKTELDEFAFTEAHDLCHRRSMITGTPWHIDHIVPLNHKDACGLHVAANFQVVPAMWNYKKNNVNMDKFLGE